MLAVGLLISLILPQQVTSQAFSRTDLCDDVNDPLLEGYISIDDLNADIADEFARVSSELTPLDSYEMILCPDAAFDTSTSPIQPLLNGMTFRCGGDDSIDPFCSISGGEIQVQVNDISVSGLPDYEMTSVNFEGLTFTGFTDTSVVLAAQRSAVATLTDITWEVRLIDYIEGNISIVLHVKLDC